MSRGPGDAPSGSEGGAPLLIRAHRIHAAAGVAEALLARDGRVVATGVAEELRTRAGSLAGGSGEAVETVDLPGLTVTAGLTDAHVHLVEWALTRAQVDLRGAGSPEEAARPAMTVHAIGDAAVDLALDVLGGEEGASLTGPVPHRIEHAQLLGPDRLENPGEGERRIVCSVQPSHLMTDWEAADRHWGERARWAFPLRSPPSAGPTSPATPGAAGSRTSG